MRTLSSAARGFERSGSDRDHHSLGAADKLAWTGGQSHSLRHFIQDGPQAIAGRFVLAGPHRLGREWDENPFERSERV